MEKKNLVLFVLLIILIIIGYIMGGCQSFPERQAAFLESGKLPPTLSELSDLKMDKKVLQNLACNIGQCSNEKIAMRNLDVLFFYVRDSQLIRERVELMPIVIGIEAARPQKNHALDVPAMASAIAEINRALARCPKYAAAQKKYGTLSPPDSFPDCVLDIYLLACYVKFIK